MIFQAYDLSLNTEWVNRNCIIWALEEEERKRERGMGDNKVWNEQVYIVSFSSDS